MTSTDREPRDAPHHYTDAEMHNPDVAHEEADIDIRTVLSFAVGSHGCRARVCRVDVGHVPGPRGAGRQERPAAVAAGAAGRRRAARPPAC